MSGQQFQQQLEPPPRPRRVRRMLPEAQKTRGEIELDDLYTLLRRSTWAMGLMLILVLATTGAGLVVLLSKGV